MIDAAQTEKALLQQVKDFARYCGWFTFHSLDSRGSDPGWPDLVLLRPPRLIIAELKSDKGKLKPAQEEWLEALSRVPWLECYIWRPENWPEIEATLQRRASA